MQYGMIIQHTISVKTRLHNQIINCMDIKLRANITTDWSSQLCVYLKNQYNVGNCDTCQWYSPGQAPVPLSIFRSNSKFDENSERSSFKYLRPITTIFCTRHDSDTVVTCAKYLCDRPRIFYTRVFWIFIVNMLNGTGAWCITWWGLLKILTIDNPWLTLMGEPWVVCCEFKIWSLSYIGNCHTLIYTPNR